MGVMSSWSLMIVSFNIPRLFNFSFIPRFFPIWYLNRKPWYSPIKKDSLYFGQVCFLFRSAARFVICHHLTFDIQRKRNKTAWLLSSLGAFFVWDFFSLNSIYKKRNTIDSRFQPSPSVSTFSCSLRLRDKWKLFSFHIRVLKCYDSR